MLKTLDLLNLLKRCLLIYNDYIRFWFNLVMISTAKTNFKSLVIRSLKDGFYNVMIIDSNLMKRAHERIE